MIVLPADIHAVWNMARKFMGLFIYALPSVWELKSFYSVTCLLVMAEHLTSLRVTTLQHYSHMEQTRGFQARVPNILFLLRFYNFGCSTQVWTYVILTMKPIVCRYSKNRWSKNFMNHYEALRSWMNLMVWEAAPARTVKTVQNCTDCT